MSGAVDYETAYNELYAQYADFIEKYNKMQENYSYAYEQYVKQSEELEKLKGDYSTLYDEYEKPRTAQS